MKKCNCPKCGMELINLTPTYKNKSYFACVECNVEVRIIEYGKEKENDR